MSCFYSPSQDEENSWDLPDLQSPVVSILLTSLKLQLAQHYTPAPKERGYIICYLRSIKVYRESPWVVFHTPWGQRVYQVPTRGKSPYNRPWLSLAIKNLFSIYVNQINLFPMSNQGCYTLLRYAIYAFQFDALWCHI